MMRKIFMAVLALMLLCSCGGKPEATPYTVAQADELLASGAFEGSQMAPLDSFIIPMLYGLDDTTVTECVGYMAVNTSASADELVILVLTDEEAAAAAEEAFRARVAGQISVCQSYCPAAVPRLEKALVSRRGNTVLLAVGAPDILASIKGIG